MDSQGLLKVTHLLNLSDAGRVARVSHPLVPDQSQVRDLEGKETVLAKWGGVTERYRKLRLRSNLPPSGLADARPEPSRLRAPVHYFAVSGGGAGIAWNVLWLVLILDVGATVRACYSVSFVTAVSTLYNRVHSHSF